ncbi:MAG: DNA-binding response regulator [Pseudomonadales bacterium]
MAIKIEQKKKVVLVVDDDTAAVSALSQLLNEEGLAVLVALEGQQAITITENITPDIILMDAKMPIMNGFDACLALKSNPDLEHIPVIFMTGLSDTEHVIKGFEVGGIDYITKPINHNELLVRMRAHLASAQSTMRAREALDESGHYLFSAHASGDILWATPHAYEAFELLGVSDKASALALAKKIAKLIGSEVKPQRGVRIEKDGLEFDIRYVNQVAPDEYLLRIVDLTGDSDTALLKKEFGLTDRESEVLAWISQGKTNREIGIILSMSPRTVNKHLEQIYKKLGVENRTTAAIISIGVLNKSR